MCQHIIPHYLCNHTGTPKITPCDSAAPCTAKINNASNTKMLSHCCSTKCCTAALNHARDRWTHAVETEESWSPTLWQQTFYQTWIRDQQFQIDMRLKAAKEYLEGMEEVHAECWRQHRSERKARSKKVVGTEGLEVKVDVRGEVVDDEGCTVKWPREYKSRPARYVKRWKGKGRAVQQ